MATTHFSGPIAAGENTGNPQTTTTGFVKMTKQVAVGAGTGNGRQIISIPSGSTILNIGATLTSAITGGTDVADMNINFGTSADPTGYGMVQIPKPTNGQTVRMQTRQVSLNASGNATVTLPPKSTLLRLGSVETSTWAPADAASAGVTNFGTGPADVGHYGIVTGASARASIVYVVPVSGATDFDTGGNIYVSCSAVSTNVTTGGGVRAFVEYAVADADSGVIMRSPTSGAATFDTGGTIIITISAAATTTFTGGGARAFVEYVTVE